MIYRPSGLPGLCPEWTGQEACPRRLSAGAWSFYIFSSGGGADELLICGFDFEFLKKLGALRHFFA